MKIENKEMLLYSMNKAYDELCEVIDDTKAEEKDVYFKLGSCLHWIIDCLDRIKEILKPSDKKLFLALSAANNALKHVKEFESAEQETGYGYPRRYPHYYGKKYLWKNLDDVPLKSVYEKRLYQEVLCGNIIINALKEARDMIDSYYREV